MCIGGELELQFQQCLFPRPHLRRLNRRVHADLTGIAGLLCARGLWDARPWARWTVAALCASSLAPQITVLEGPQGLAGLALSLALIAYLFLPSTGRLFARAGGAP